MTDAPEGTPVVTPAQAHQVVKGLAPFNTYLAADLYERYVVQCEQDGRIPAHPVVLGRALRNIGCDRRKKGTGARASAAWLVTSTSQRPEWADGAWSQ